MPIITDRVAQAAMSYNIGYSDNWINNWLASQQAIPADRWFCTFNSDGEPLLGKARSGAATKEEAIAKAIARNKADRTTILKRINGYMDELEVYNKRMSKLKHFKLELAPQEPVTTAVS